MTLWSRIRGGLGRTRESLTRGLEAALRRRGPVDPATRQNLEDALLLADVGPAMAEQLLAGADRRLRDESVDLKAALEREVETRLAAHTARFAPGEGGAAGAAGEGGAGGGSAGPRPWVALIVGVNGVGKTTLAGKLAAHFASQGRRTLLVAADTFRAAAAEQLETWAARAGVEIVRGRDGEDPSSVIHNALSAALARGVDVVLIDTAGRLHTKHNLMAELEKVRRVCAARVPGAPHHVLLVLDATLGQNALAQAREFQRATSVTSLAMNKLDGSARGGALLAIAEALELPVSVVGVGEGLEDWEDFDPAAFAAALFEAEPAAG
jgi:fused signal recognition particle receptor